MVVEGQTITNMIFDKMSYFQAAIDQYLVLATEELKKDAQHLRGSSCQLGHVADVRSFCVGPFVPDGEMDS